MKNSVQWRIYFGFVFVAALVTVSIYQSLLISQSLGFCLTKADNSMQAVGKYYNILDELIANNWTNFHPKSLKISHKSHENILQNDENIPRIYLVPNVVHYVWLGRDLNFTFIHYLSFLSVHRYINPDLILVYGETGPSGTWWNATLRDVDNIYHVVTEAPKTAPNGIKFLYKAHESDLLRTQIIYLFGGIYLDADVIVLRSFDPLRRYPMVMGREYSHGVCNGIIIAEKRAPFVHKLLKLYDTYKSNEGWGDLSVHEPHRLAKEFPHLIHVEETTLHQPNGGPEGLQKIYDITINWSQSYSIHLWIRMQQMRSRIAESPKDIDCLNTTFGEVARHAYYGSKTPIC